MALNEHISAMVKEIAQLRARVKELEGERERLRGAISRHVTSLANLAWTLEPTEDVRRGDVEIDIDTKWQVQEWSIVQAAVDDLRAALEGK